MSKPISFEGASDDLAYVIVDGRPDEYDAYDGAQLHIVSRAGQLQIDLDLNRESGCWAISASQTDETHAFPKWPITITQSPDCGYSTRLTVTAPDDARVVITK
ncbi:hypothetical protein [Rhodococcoides fascians]|uniref:hypothetical protein n=1 Tax=Rhodococcoides fascians TaxID=1828 RepID=UPI00050CAD91|nr:hypothetical protein [Rhodococcus fascians]